MKSGKILILALILLTAAYQGFAGCDGDANENAAVFFLFDEVSTQEILSHPLEQATPPSQFPASDRSRPVVLTPSIMREGQIKESDILILNLFEGIEYTAGVDRLTTNINGTYTIRARIEDMQYSYVLISTTGEQTEAVIVVPEQNKRFAIKTRPDTKESYLLDLCVEKKDYIVPSPPLIPQPPNKKDSVQIQTTGYDSIAENFDIATIDVMVVYTPAARNWAGGHTAMANIIAQAMEKAQLTLDNSDTYVDINLVHSAEINYTESGNSAADLRRLTASAYFNPWGDDWEGYSIPDYMDEVHDWRDEHGADLVALFANLSDVGGTAWLLNSTSGMPYYGFSMTRVQQATGFTHIHEIGHNMGCHHHKEQNFSQGPGLYEYSAGWRWTGNNNNYYCSVMTYEPGEYFVDGINHTRVAYFSNPDIYHQGQPTGHPEDGDNSRTIRQMRHTIAGYRSSEIVNTLTISPTSQNYTPSSNTGSISVSSNISWTASNSESWITITSGASGSGNGTVNYSISANTGSQRSGTITISGEDITRIFTIHQSALVEFPGGDGTEGNPYQISTREHLEAVNDDLSAKYILINEIDLTGIVYQRAVIAPNIGSSPELFIGTFDGNGFIIRNLTITQGGTNSGLFGQIEGAVIKNLGIIDCNVSGRLSIGSLIGLSSGSAIKNCFSTGIVNGSTSVGGLIGNASGSNSVISNCYSIAEVTGMSSIGGLCGSNSGTIISSYATGKVSGSISAGGLCGDNTGTINSSFWDMDTSEKDTSQGGTGKTTAQMQDINTFLDEGWDFVNETDNGQMQVWYMLNDDYPRLYWQAAAGDIIYDGKIGMDDLAVLADQWLQNPQEQQRLQADINQDGIVDYLDYKVLASQWLVE